MANEDRSTKKVDDNNENEESLINQLTDAEFLSFLYAERERQSSQRKYQGWNLWVLIGAIATVSGIGYNIIKDNVNTISILNVIYCLSGLLAFILSLRPWSNFFEHEKAVDHMKVRFFKEVVPIDFILFSVIIATIFSILVIQFDTDNPWNEVSITWVLFFFLLLYEIIYCFINRDEIVKAPFNDILSINKKTDIWLWILECGLLTIVWVNSFKHISYSTVISPDFELSICITAICLLFVLVIKVHKSETEVNKVDIYIDEYLYKKGLREAIYRLLRMSKMGNTPLEACSNELLKMKKYFEVYESKKGHIEEIDKLVKSGDISYEKVQYYMDTIDDNLKYLTECIDKADRLGEKLMQIESHIPSITMDQEFIFLESSLQILVEREKILYEITKTTWNRLQLWMDNYLCHKYGGFCKKECEQRYENPRFWFRIKLWFMKKKTMVDSKHRRNCKRS